MGGGCQEGGAVKVSLNSVTVEFGQRGRHLVAIRDISFDIEDEFVAVVGLSGSGKSTLLRVLGGLIKPSKGDVSFSSESYPICGMVFQEYSLLPWKSVLENVILGLRLRRVDKDERKPIAVKMLGQVGLIDYLDFYPHELSGGMQQRVAVACALARDPDLLLMDEPFGALDAVTREDLQELVDGLYTTRKKTTFFVTHDVEEAVYLADRVYVLGGDSQTICGEITIGFPRPRPREIRESAHFIDMRHQVFKMLRSES